MLDSVAWGTAPAATYTANSSVGMTGFTVQLLDSSGNLISSNSTSNVVLSVFTGNASLGGTLTRTVSNGVATFTGITYTKAEALVIQAKELAANYSSLN